MQPIPWYVNRLSTMSPAEIAWRITSLSRDCFDRIRIPFHFYPGIESVASQANTPGFSVSNMPVGAWSAETATDQEKIWLTSLLEIADKIADHRFCYFDLKDHDHGNPVDWHYDHGNDQKSPLRFSAGIDYRNVLETGDCKLVWEPNRHHHLVILGRAYRASGNMKYAEAVREQLRSWLDQNPFGLGMNWRSPLELAIRLINWVWAFDLIRDSAVVSGGFRDQVLHSVHLHLWDITRKFSRGSSANNHLIGEAAGVHIACCYFPSLPEAARWRQKSHDILCQQALAQTSDDGGNKELALGYHFFVLQFLLFAGLVGRWSGKDFPSAYWRIIEKMVDFLACLAQGGNTLPLYGDCDDGYVLNLGNGPHDHAALLAVGAALFNRPDFKVLANALPEPLYWLLGKDGVANYGQLTPTTADHISSKALPGSGLYLLQTGHPEGENRISAIVDCGDLGYKSIAAHGHADALSLTLRIAGHAVLIDPGTYDYFSFPTWRNYFRSTRAHNTVEIDGQDQSIMQGPFLWGKKAIARCLAWEPSPTGGKLIAEHDGYTRLIDPATHRRTVTLDGEKGILGITDEILSTTSHAIRIFFHFAPDCILEEIEQNKYVISVSNQKIRLCLAPALSAKLLHGREAPVAGWFSPGYHTRIPSPTLIAEAICTGPCHFHSTFTVDTTP